MNKQEIKQWKRERAYKKIARFARMYNRNATEMILGAIIIPPAFLGLFIVAGSL